MLLLPILGIVTCLLICALIYNNLDWRALSEAPRNATDLHHTRDPLPDLRVVSPTPTWNKPWRSSVSSSTLPARTWPR